jgi:DDHD domain
MNPAVDSSYARNNITPVEIPRTLLQAPTGALSHAATVASSLLPSSSPTPPEKSTIEMETHDFRSEARAERIFGMLNDNGGLDFMLAPLGGWVDNEYVSMLSAHSGYWDRRDFARMIIVETGREDGRTVDWLRAQKKVV